MSYVRHGLCDNLYFQDALESLKGSYLGAKDVPLFRDQGVALATNASSGICRAVRKPRPMEDEGVSTVGRLPDWREGAALAWRDPASEVDRLDDGELSKVVGLSGAAAEPATSPAKLLGVGVSR